MSKFESPNSVARSLKQAQLPFVALKKTDSAQKSTQKKISGGQDKRADNHKDKENVCTNSKHHQETVNGKPRKLKSRNIKPMIVDLTEDESDHGKDSKCEDVGQLPFSTLDSIENTIDSVVKRYSSEFEEHSESCGQDTLSAKKRRRRCSGTLSPVPQAKRAVIHGGNEGTPVANGKNKCHKSTLRKNLPEIIVTAPTPVKDLTDERKKKILKTAFEDLLKHDAKDTCGNDTDTPLDSSSPVKQWSKYPPLPCILAKRDTCHAGANTSSDPSQVKQGPKYPPLSRILGRKRSRSKSPTGTKKHVEAGKDVSLSSAAENESDVIDSTEDLKPTVAVNKSENILAAFLRSPKQKCEIKPKKAKVRCNSPIEREPEVISIEEDHEKQQPEKIFGSPKIIQSSLESVTPSQKLSRIAKHSGSPSKNIQSSPESATPPQKLSKTAEDSGSPPKNVQSVTPEQKLSAAKDSSPNSGAKGRRSLEAQRKKEEKEKEKEERRRQREKQRSAKEQEKLELKQKMEEKKAQKQEERRKKKEEEEATKAERQRKLEEKRVEKEKLEMEKKLEKERKEEERRKEKERKDEEKRQKELEKQKIEKEKVQAEEEKRRRNERRAENFKSFFKSPTRSAAIKKITENTGIFAPFQPKQDMLLAPLHRHKISSAEKLTLDKLMEKQDFTSFYLQGVSSRPRVCSGPTMPRRKRKLVSLAEDGLELVDDETDSKPGAKILRAKFLLFHMNHRPPYYGTWRKESNVLSCRNPFKKDSDLFDYDFDSDDEWEEPVEGEDIANSDEEGDEADANEEDEDDGFFVPHGYLSDDEGINEDGEEDNQKPDHKLKQKQLEFEASFKRKLSTLTPIVIGCVWKDAAESLDKVHRDILNNYKPEFLSPTPIEIFPRSTSPSNDSENLNDCSKSEQARKSHSSLKPVPEEAMPDLIRLLHGNALSMSRIVNEFRAYWTIKKSGNERLTVGPASLDEICHEDKDQPMDTSAGTVEISPTKMEIASEILQAKDNVTKTIVSTPKVGDKCCGISKTQLLKKCKEIATYTKRDNMNRSCWFVHDHVLEQYQLGNEKVPVPCKWNYATEVPKIQILIFPQTPQIPTPIPEPVEAPLKQSPGPSIAKFVAKVSPNVILEQSKLKHDKEKLTTAAVPSISKYTTEKISPTTIIQQSAQKIEENLAKAKQTQESEGMKSGPDSTQPEPQEGTYIIPTPDAVRSFFRIDDNNVDLTS